MPTPRLITRIRPGWGIVLFAFCAAVALLVPTFAGAQSAPSIDGALAGYQNAGWDQQITFDMSDVSGATGYSLYSDHPSGTCAATPAVAGFVSSTLDPAARSLDASPVSDGDWCFWVVADGATSQASSPVEITYDGTPPAVPSDLVAVSTDTQGAPTFTYTPDSDANGAYNYQLFRETTPIGSPSHSGTLTDGGLSTDGSHTYVVRVTDQAGNEADSSGIVVTRDTVDPSVTIDGSSEPAANASSNVANFTFSADSGTLTCKLDSGSFVACDSSTSMGYTNLSEGSHTFTVRATDAAGNVGSDAYTWNVDTVAPAVTISSTPAANAASTSAAFVFSAGAGTLRCQVDATPVTACDSSTTMSYTGLGQGSHTFAVTSTDAAGNVGTATYTWNVDTVVPTVTIDAGSKPAVNASSTTASFTFTPDSGALTCKLDGGSFGACTSGTSMSYTGLGQGSHTFTVHATDLAGNVGSDAYTWNVDTVVPVVTISSTPAANASSTSAAFVFSADSGTLTCQLDTTTVTACATSTTMSYSGLSQGSHTFAVTATDAANNVRQVTYTWNVDTVLPVVTLTARPGDLTTGHPTASPNATFSWTVVESGTATTLCKLDSGSFAACSSPVSLTAVADGSHTYTVQSTDAAGNVGTDAWTWTVDTTPPSVPGSFTLVDHQTTRNTVPVFSYSSSTDPGPLPHGATYELFRNGADTGVSSSTGSIQDSTLALNGSDDGSYTYQVASVDSFHNQSALSSGVSVTIDAGPPSVPGAVHVATSPTRNAPVIVWNASTGGASTYKVLRDGTAIGTVFAPTTTFTDSSLSLTGTADGNHAYTVVAIDTLGNASAASAGANELVDTTRPVSAGSLAVASPTAAKPVLVWAASADGAVAGYNVYRGTTLLNSTLVQGTSFADATLSGDGTYTYTVRAVDTAGNESLDSAAASVVYDTTVPTAPTTIVGTPAAGGKATLTWAAAADAGSGVGSYQVRRSAPNGPAPASLAEGTPVCGVLAGTATSCADTGLTAGSSYRYSVFAVDVVGNVSAPGASGPVLQPSGKDTTPPKAPTTVKDKVSGTKAVLTWKNPQSDLAKVVVLWNASRTPRSSSDGKVVYTGTGTTFGIALAKLPAGKKVHFAVFALDDAGNASPAATATVTVPQAGPLSVAPGGKLSGSPTLSWKTIAKTQYYNVQVFEGNGTTKRVAIAWPYTTHWAIPSANLVKGKTYTWYVWPGIGPKKAAKYGTLIGKQTFTYTG